MCDSESVKIYSTSIANAPRSQACIGENAGHKGSYLGRSRTEGPKGSDREDRVVCRSPESSCSRKVEKEMAEMDPLGQGRVGPELDEDSVVPLHVEPNVRG